jgi:hypothetical protein
VSTRSKGSLELVGEFFEVRAQVDRDLTTVSRVDRRLGLIKNLGRHMSPMKDLLRFLALVRRILAALSFMVEKSCLIV